MSQTTERTHGRDLSGEDMARLLGEFVNAMGGDKNAQLAVAVTREHRTLQRNIFCMALDVIDGFADMERVDARNEQTREMAREVQALIGGRRPWMV